MIMFRTLQSRSPQKTSNMSPVRSVVLLISLCAVQALYEDQAGKFDWKQDYVGKISTMFWDQSQPTGGRRLIVATEKNALAAIHALNGSIAWRRLFETDERGHIDALLHQSERLVTVQGHGQFVRGWHPGSGSLVWEATTDEEGDPNVRVTAQLVEHNKKELVVAVTPKDLYGMRASDGKRQWKLEMPNGDSVQRWLLAPKGSDLLAVGLSPEDHVTVVTISLEGSVGPHVTIPATWLTPTTSCQLVGSETLVCYNPVSLSLQSLSLAGSKAFTSTPLSELGVTGTGEGSWLEGLGEGLVLLRLTRGSSALLAFKSSKPSLVKALNKVSAAQIGTFADKKILLTVERETPETVLVRGLDLTSNKPVFEVEQSLPFPASNGIPQQIHALLFPRKRDGTLSAKMAFVSDDLSVHLAHKAGKVAWRREEALAYLLAVEMVDLPVSENEAKFEDEFGTRKQDIFSMFIRRLVTQLSQLQTFVHKMIHKLQHLSHKQAAVYQGEDDSMEEAMMEEEEEEELVRDSFNLHKIIVAASSAGKIYGMRSNTGRLVWQHFMPELAPFDRFNNTRLLMYVQRTTAHFPNPAQCVVIGKHKTTGYGLLLAFNPITGQRVEGIPAEGLQLPYTLAAASLLPDTDAKSLRGVVLMDRKNKVHFYPESMESLVLPSLSSHFLYLADLDSGTLSGYRLTKGSQGLEGQEVWQVNLQKQQQTITGIFPKRINEHVHSQGRVLGDRSVLYKYLNPNLVVVLTQGLEPPSSSQKGPSSFFSLYLVDVVTGHMVFSINHKRAAGPVEVVHSENWVVYSYYNEKQRRYEMAVLEMYEGKEQSNPTTFSSFNPPPTPLVMRQAYILSLPHSHLAATLTEKGITSKNILVALKNGAVLSMPKAFLDPRRPVVPTHESMEEGTIPYVPELPIQLEAVINYNRSIFNVQGIHTAPSGLESTSIVLVYGIDLFYTRVMPSRMFDVLKEDFDYVFIGAVLFGMIFVSLVTQKLAAKKALSRAWK